MIALDNFCAVGNSNKYSYEQYQFNLITFPVYLVKLKIALRRLTTSAVRSVEPIVPNFRIKSFNVRFFPSLLENSFSSLLTETILHWHGFYQKIIFKLSMVI